MTDEPNNPIDEPSETPDATATSEGVGPAEAVSTEQMTDTVLAKLANGGD